MCDMCTTLHSTYIYIRVRAFLVHDILDRCQEILVDSIHFFISTDTLLTDIVPTQSYRLSYIPYKPE